MTEGDEKYKLGELTSDTAAVKSSQSEMRSDIKEVRDGYMRLNNG